MRTSQSDPIRIAEIPYPVSGGFIGVTLCPGKNQRDGMSGHWARDLAIDLEAIATWGAGTIVTLIEDDELIELGVKSLGSEVTVRKMRWLHLPIADRHAPDAAWDDQWLEVRVGLHAALRAGKRILVHCRGGLGRAGTVAARLLIEAGVASEVAMALVREKRRNAIETIEQEAYLRMQESKVLLGLKSFASECKLPDPFVKVERDGIHAFVFCADEHRRYAFSLTWDDSKPHLLWIMLNPGTGETEGRRRNTLERCKRWSRDSDYGGLIFGNVFSLRTKSAKELAARMSPADRQDDVNKKALIRLSELASGTIVAWGNRGAETDPPALLRPPMCLGYTKAGQPRHPLYVRANTPLIEWRPVGQPRKT